MNNPVTPAAPGAIQALEGFLGKRFEVNLAARLKDPLLSEQYIRLHEKKNHDEWFWLGEQIGKWMEAAAYAGLTARDAGLIARVGEIIDRLEQAQEDSGYLGITREYHRHAARGMELYEMYYVLLGLESVYRLLGSQKALNIAKRLAGYIMQTWGGAPGQFPLVGPFPGNGHNGGEGTLSLEPVAALTTLTGDPQYAAWAEACLQQWDEWWQRYPKANHSCGWSQMQKFAAGEIDVWEQRENIHAHTYHMTLLGIAELYNATGKEVYRQVVLRSIDRIAAEWVFLTGGMSSHERYTRRKYYHPRNDVEVCPQHTWILLLEQALKWTGEARYAAEIERDLFNHLLAAQLADGSNWSYMTGLNGKAEEPWSSNCCNASGHRIAGRMPTFLYGLRGGSPAIFIYTQSSAVLDLPQGGQVTLQQTTQYPSQGQVAIQVQPDAAREFELHLRIPPFAEGSRWRINGGEWVPAPAGDFLVIARRWQAGDQVELDIPFPLTVQADARLAAVTRGPLVYCLFQNAQDDTGKLYKHQGIFPEDHCLLLDPQDPVQSLREEPAQPGLLGPGLRVKAILQPQSPVFAGPSANSQLLPPRAEEVLLLPFVNQGQAHGEYRVFNYYIKL